MPIHTYSTPYIQFLNRYHFLRRCRYRDFVGSKRLLGFTSNNNIHDKRLRPNAITSRDSFLSVPTTFIGVPVRSCFHPGTSNLTREELGLAEKKETVVSSGFILKALASYVWPKDKPFIRYRVIGAMSLLVAAKGMNVVVPSIFGNIVDTFGPNAGVILQNPGTAILASGMAMIAGYGIARTSASAFNELRNAVFARVAHDSTRRVARNVFLHLHNLDLRFHLTRRTGGLSKAVDRGTRGINFLLSAIVFNIAPTALELGIVTTILGYRFGYEYALATFAFTGLYAAFTFATTHWRTKFRIQMNRADQEAGNIAVDSLLNYETVKYFNNEQLEADRYEKHLAKYESASLKTTTSLAFLNWGQNAIFSAAMATTMGMVGYGVLRGQMTIGDMVLVNGLVFQLSIPLGFLGSVYRETRQALIDMGTMFSIMEQPPAIRDPPGAPALMLPRGAEDATIEFKDVVFGYNSQKKIFNSLSFTVPAGHKVAIVGGSGSGKSTIVRLLYRFYEPQSGQILINGQSINQVTLDSLRRAIAVVPQDCVLFHDSIYYNIQYGDVKASQEQVYEAARMADVHDAVLRMPNGYRTVVGERGLMLSGGEKQRVAIARALLKKSPVFVYDEATSSLDSITEQNILNSMKRAAAGRTTLVIAHRLSTVADADEIIVLGEGGSVVERGSHSDLMVSPVGIYRSLWLKQHEAALKKQNGEHCDDEDRPKADKEPEIDGDQQDKLSKLLSQINKTKGGCDNCSC